MSEYSENPSEIQHQADAAEAHVALKVLEVNENLSARPYGPENLPPALEPFTRVRGWVLWKRKTRTNKKGEVKITKPPVDSNGTTIDVTNSANWRTYAEVIRDLRAGKGDGIGIAVGVDHPDYEGVKLGGADLDRCFDGVKADDHANMILAQLNSYVEISPSGEGFRVFGLTRGGKIGCGSAHPSNPEMRVELYRFSSERYLTVTGNELRRSKDQVSSAGRLNFIDKAMEEIEKEVKSWQKAGKTTEEVKAKKPGKAKKGRSEENDAERVRDLLRKSSYPSGSEPVHAVAMTMVRQDKSDGEIVQFLMSLPGDMSPEEFPAAHAAAKHIAGDEAIARRQAEKARIKVEKQEAEARAAAAEVAKDYPLPAMSSMGLVYKRRPDGRVWVHKLTEDDTFVPVASPFGVVARLRIMDQNESYGLRVVLQGMNGRRREIDLDRAAFGRNGGGEIRERLMALGLRVERDGDNIAVQCLKAADPEKEIMVVKKPGWHRIEGIADPIFVFPSGEVVGAPPELDLEVDVSTRLPPDIAKGGTLEGWKDAISAAIGVEGCPHWRFAAMAGFAGPLVALTRLDSVGIAFSGRTTLGKTVALKCAVSPYSLAATLEPQSLLRSARSTVNATEGMASKANGTVLAIDELALVPGKEVGKLVYMVASNTGKNRMAADGSARESHTWSTFSLFSSELSLEEKIRSDGGEWTGGMAVRIPDVDVTGASKVDAPTLGRINALSQHYGHAGPAFIRGLVSAGLHRQAEQLRDQILELANRIAGKGNDGAHARAALPFAIVHMAGGLAQQMGVLPPELDVAVAVQWAWARFDQSTDARILDPEREAVAKLRAYIAQRWNVTIRPLGGCVGDEKSSREAVGWYDEEAVYLLRNNLREGAGGSYKEAEVAKMLDERGFLARKKDAKHRYLSYIRVIGKVDVYALSRREFGRMGDEAEPDNELKLVPAGAQDRGPGRAGGSHAPF